MSRFVEWIKKSYILIILILFYLPLFFMIVFSFNKTSDKGYISFDNFNGFTWEAYRQLFSSETAYLFVNSFILAITVSVIVIALSLVTVFSLWRQKNKVINVTKNVTYNIINVLPDVVIGISLAAFFAIAFNELASDNEGFFNAVIGHVVMVLPYGILVMYPKSEKFKNSIFEASYDLGYSKVRTWFNTYFVYMLSSIGFTLIISVIFSFDDFIITRMVSNMETVGTELYQGNFQPWALAFGSILIIIIFAFNLFFYIKNKKRKA
ncbi:MAG: ABC transporter permease [Metamycoplasmataceae bacterium]